MRLPRLILPALVLGTVLAACGGGATATPAPTAAPPTAALPTAAAPTAAAPTTAPATAATGGVVTVNLADSTLGKILADGDGMTLYVFTPDTAGTSTCYEGCAKAWPPLLADAAPTLGAGLDATDFGTTSRTDGTTQVTFYGMPLYYFASDTAAGQTSGQGVGGKWYVVGADGKLIK